MNPAGDPRFTPAVALLGRTGAQEFRIGYSPEEDGLPVVWYAVVTYLKGSEAAAAMNPVDAVLRLCEQVIDGGVCAHCMRLTIFVADLRDDSAGLQAMGCVYAWDPELATFRRNCEGDT